MFQAAPEDIPGRHKEPRLTANERLLSGLNKQIRLACCRMCYECKGQNPNEVHARAGLFRTQERLA
jgi:hypothetical protein